MANDVTPEMLEDAILTVTGIEDWKIIQQGLYNEVQAAQAGALNLPTWEDVCEERGFMRGLIYCITLRDQLLAAKAQRERDRADL